MIINYINLFINLFKTPTIAPAHDQLALHKVQGVEVPVGGQVGQEAGGGVVGLREEGLYVPGGVPGEAPAHHQHGAIVVTHLYHLLLPLPLAAVDIVRTADNQENDLQ